MGEIFEKIFYLLVLLPFLMISEGYAKFKAFMDEKKAWGKFPYVLIMILVIILLVLLAEGYRW